MTKTQVSFWEKRIGWKEELDEMKHKNANNINKK